MVFYYPKNTPAYTTTIATILGKYTFTWSFLPENYQVMTKKAFLNKSASDFRPFQVKIINRMIIYYLSTLGKYSIFS